MLTVNNYPNVIDFFITLQICGIYRFSLELARVVLLWCSNDRVTLNIGVVSILAVFESEDSYGGEHFDLLFLFKMLKWIVRCSTHTCCYGKSAKVF